MNRRDFLRTAALVTASASLGNPSTWSEEKRPGVSWPIGCFNRPWANWDFDTALDGIKASGFQQVGLLSRTKDEPFVGSEASDEYLQHLTQRIQARGLAANMAAIDTRYDIPLGESIRDLQKQVDNARFLSLGYLMSFGVEDSAQFDSYCQLMANAAAYADKSGIQVVLKPHGGVSLSSKEILLCLRTVNHRNFRIWYDAGNIIYYGGNDPTEELEPLAGYVTGFCAKDCDRPKGDVMIQFGTGKVDFKKVLGRLKAVGFDGPIMVECSAPGPTPESVTANVRANRSFLEKTLATL
jgi:sugar phosphate isomerase/epimerase